MQCKELLPGPDLANKLVGILTKLGENTVAFMADTEKCIFKYLLLSSIEVCFNFYGGRKKISQTSQFIMRCVHMFGGVSSVACSNYTENDSN